MRATLACLLLSACLIAGCGDTETTVINQTTTVSSPTIAETGSETVTSDTTVAPTTPTPPDLAEPEEEETDPRDYSGPCGEPGAVTGGTPGGSATTAVPGFANLETSHATCTLATTVAAEWIEAWEASCASGCVRRIEEMQCDYGGSGTAVRCRSSESEVSFDLVFRLE